MSYLHDQRGQSAVELMGLLPLVAVLGLAMLQLLSAGLAVEFANHAAEAGALAIAQGRDPKEAIKESLPDFSSSKVEQKLTSGGRKVEVTITPLKFVPGLAKELKATASADAGEASP